MNLEHPHHHNDHVTDDDGDAMSAADFYFNDPALLFPLSPTSVRKEMVSLTPSRAPASSSSSTMSPRSNGGVRLTLSKFKTSVRSNRNTPLSTVRPTAKVPCPTLSPGSEGTDATTDWMEDEDDVASCCGSLTYSVETDELADDYDCDQNVATVLTESAYVVLNGEPKRKEDRHECFQILDVVISVIQRIFQKPEPKLCNCDDEHVHGCKNDPRVVR